MGCASGRFKSLSGKILKRSPLGEVKAAVRALKKGKRYYTITGGSKGNGKREKISSNAGKRGEEIGHQKKSPVWQETRVCAIPVNPAGIVFKNIHTEQILLKTFPASMEGNK